MGDTAFSRLEALSDLRHLASLPVGVPGFVIEGKFGIISMPPQ
jgi:hypothetical protein